MVRVLMMCGEICKIRDLKSKEVNSPERIPVEFNLQLKVVF